ncbi:MAG TPA: sigma-70 family RNA polymerase sigma factor, partial [Candidatus Latescibacteria bacterium]|nr:sigma-70 family RNA polymerase sigma factor [Candidatus Latescibacterota bacterium]
MSELLFVEQFTRQSEMVTDEDLLAQSLDGSVNAFEVIVNRYKDRLFNFVVRFVGDQETAEDIVQETFLRAYRNRDTFQAVAKFSTWIYTIAGNLAKSELRRRKRWRFLSLGSK